MPPKRKAKTQVITTTDPKELVARKLKIAKKKEATAHDKQETNRIKKWFEKYADSESGGKIGHDGCQAFFADCSVSLESIQPIIIAYKMNSTTMGYITWDQWFEAMKSCGATESNFKNIVDQWEKAINSDPEEFKKLYVFAFNYAKSTGQKSLEVETAMALWPIFLREKHPLIESFMQFLQDAKPVQVINKDQWTSMLDFCEAIAPDLHNYDSMSSWPVLFDDYVEWKTAL